MDPKTSNKRPWVVVIAVGVVGVVGVVGCFDAALPANVHIACAQAGDCPADLRCALTIGTCVAKDSDDVVPPGLSQASIEPGRGRADTVFSVSFDVDEALAFPPRVVATSSLGAVAFELNNALSDSARFHWSLTLDTNGQRPNQAEAQELPEGSHPVTAELIDLLGNVSTALPVATLVVDRSGPRLVADPLFELLPPAGALLDTVGAASVGAGVRVGIVVDEDLSTPPALSGSGVIFEAVRRNDRSFVFAGTIPAEAENGPLSFTLDLVDQAGNASQIALNADFDIDVEKPRAPTAGCLLLRREPWGSARSRAFAGVQVELNNDCRLDDDVRSVIVSQGQSGAELLRADVVDGHFDPLLLPVVDVVDVSVQVVDDAANAAVPVSPAQVEWVATLGGKVARNPFPNPNRFELRAVHTASLANNGGREADSALYGEDGVSAHVEGAGHWLHIDGAANPQAELLSATYDEGSGNVVAFSNGLVWRFTGSQFLPLTPTDPEGDDSPISTAAAVVAWHPSLLKVLLFGGEDGGVPLNDTWLWDGQSFEKVDPSGCPEGPGPLRLPALTRHPTEAAVMLFGGQDRSGLRNQTWIFGDDLCWTRGPDLPSVAFGIAAAFDPQHQRVVLLGGGLGQTLVYDGAAFAPLPGPQPAERSFAALAPLPAGGFLMVGGLVDNVGSTEVWHLDDDDTWRLLPVPPDDVGVRVAPSLVLDRARNRLVLSGTGDTREWNGTTFVPIVRAPASSNDVSREFPIETRAVSALGVGALAFGDATTFGSGVLPAFESNLLEGPSSRSSPALAFDGAHVLLFGGGSGEGLNETWLFVDEQWIQFTGPGPTSISRGLGLALDEARGKVVLFGAGNLDETWEWDGVALTWTQVFPLDEEGDGNPTGRAFAGCVFEPLSNEVLLQGGLNASEQSLDDTWTFDGRRWRNRTPIDPLDRGGPRAFHGASVDAARGKAVVVGGRGGAIVFDDVLEWDGRRWLRRSIADPEGDGRPLRRIFPALLPDPRGQGVLLLAGAVLLFDRPFAANDGVWQWQGGADERPSAVFDIDLGAAQLPNARLTALDLHVVGGAHGGPDLAGAPGVPGVALVWWREGRFEVIASHTAVGLGDLDFHSTDAALLSTLKNGADGRIVLGIVSLGTNGTGTAVLDVDYVEARFVFDR